MTLLHCRFHSDVLATATAMTVTLPDVGPASPPVLYLLHGLGDDETAWTRHASIERYASERGIAVVMPRGGRSFWVDEARGDPYARFLREELPERVTRMLRVSTRPEDTFVAGLSMGGYGAVLWGLAEPDRFGAVASLSGALGLAEHSGTTIDPVVGGRLFDGRDVRGGRWDPFALLAAADPASAPPLRISCGTADGKLDENERFAAAAAARGLSVTTDFGPGAHDWDYWDADIRAVLDWLPVA